MYLRQYGNMKISQCRGMEWCKQVDSGITIENKTDEVCLSMVVAIQSDKNVIQKEDE
jgi:hypothetical protein